MKINEIKMVVELMSKHKLSEFKIEAEEMNLTLKRESNPCGPVQYQAVPNQTTMQAAPAPDTPDSSEKTEDAKEGKVIVSPIVGTFYEASSPDADPFVKPGMEVNPDTVVCIVEAMKVLNEIKAEKSGIIKKVLVENAQPVEYGQPLFVIE